MGCSCPSLKSSITDNHPSVRVTSSHGFGGGVGSAHMSWSSHWRCGVGGRKAYFTVGLSGKVAAQVLAGSNCQRRLPGALLHRGGRSPAGGRLLTPLRKPCCPENRTVPNTALSQIPSTLYFSSLLALNSYSVTFL